MWEVLDGGLKSKIEIQWSDIEAIRATIVDDQPGILEIEVIYLTFLFNEFSFTIVVLAQQVSGHL